MFDNILFGYATFLDCCIRNEISISQFDDFVNAWHNSACSRPMAECIGSHEVYRRLASENSEAVLNEYVERVSNYNK